MKCLYIFVTTDRPDQYLNSVVYCIEKGVRKIIFIQIEDDRTDDRTEKVKLNLLSKNVYSLLEDLSMGLYRHYTGFLKDRIVKLELEYTPDDLARIKARYHLCLADEIDWSVDRIKYLDLRAHISKTCKNKDALIDVTSVSKAYLGDIFACSLLEGTNQIYTFDLRTKLDFSKPWKMLIHELADREDYRYTNLVETPVFRDCSKSILIKTIPLIISVIGTVLFVSAAFVTTLFFGFDNIFIKALSVIGTVLGIASFVFVFFPIRGK